MKPQLELDSRQTGAFARLREEFPILQRRVDGRPLVYLDSAATSLKPRSVIDAVVAYYTESTANIHRGQHVLSEEASNQYESARTTVAQYLNCSSSEICFFRNTTEALNVVAHGLVFSADDTVLGFLDSHHSQILPWRRKAKLALVRVGADGRVDMDHYAELLRTRPRAVAITHCSNVTGAYVPLAQMVSMAKESGALTIVDAAQSLPHRIIDLATIPIDFLAFSSHKMLGPSGVGCLFGRGALLDQMEPVNWGGGMVDWVDAQSSRPRKIPHRFEAGTPAIESTIGFAHALEFLERHDPEAIARHDHHLSTELLRHACERSYLRFLGPTDANERAAILSLRVQGVDDLSMIARALSDSYGIMCRSGHLCAQPLVDSFSSSEVLRVSGYIYNTTEDISFFFRALDEIVSHLHVAGA